MKAELSINGETRAVEADADTPLLWILRDHLGMTGTKFGCGIGQCGACTVHFNGAATRSCLLPLQAAAGATITTIEGLGGRHPLQRAWLDLNVAQCGYCQAGMLMAAAERSAVSFRLQHRYIRYLRRRRFRSFDFLLRYSSLQRVSMATQPKSDFFGLGLSPVLQLAAQTCNLFRTSPILPSVHSCPQIDLGTLQRSWVTRRCFPLPRGRGIRVRARPVLRLCIVRFFLPLTTPG